MKQIFNKFRLFLIPLTLFFLICPFFSKAATTGIQISPLTYNFELSPGESKQAYIKVTNINNTNLEYIIEVELFKNTSKEGAPSFEGVTKPEGATTLADWINIAKKDQSGVIAPKKSKQIDFTITVPKGAEPGGHYAAVFAKQVQKTPEGKVEIGVASRVGTLILVSVPGEVKKGAEISEFNPATIVWQGPVTFNMEVTNTGTVHYDSQATLNIKPWLSSTRSMDMGTHTILPSNAREYEAVWQNKFPFGFYSLTAIALDGDGQEVSKDAWMIAIPLIIVIPVLAAIILFIILIKYLKKHVKFEK